MTIPNTGRMGMPGLSSGTGKGGLFAGSPIIQQMAAKQQAAEKEAAKEEAGGDAPAPAQQFVNPIKEMKDMQTQPTTSAGTGSNTPLTDEAAKPLAGGLPADVPAATADADPEDVAGDEGDEGEPLPRGAGKIDYRDDANPIPVAMTDDQRAAYADQGVIFIDTKQPVVFKERVMEEVKNEAGEVVETRSAVTPKGNPKFKTTKAMVSYGVSLTEPEAEQVAEEAAQLIFDHMIHLVVGHLDKQDIRLPLGTVFTSEWLSTHFGAESLMDAIIAEFRPWESVSMSSSAAEALVCNLDVGGRTPHELVDMAASDMELYFTKIHKSQFGKEPTASDMKAYAGPIVKLVAKYEAFQKRTDKAVEEGKKTPVWKLPALPATTLKAIQVFITHVGNNMKERRAQLKWLEAGNRPRGVDNSVITTFMSECPDTLEALNATKCILTAIHDKMKADQDKKAKASAAVAPDANAMFSADSFRIG